MSVTAETLIERHLPSASNAHYALLLTPSRKRLAAAAILSFDAQMRELCALSRDVAPAKLHWWHEEIERLRSGQPRHPLTQCLADVASDTLVDRLNDRLHGAVVDFNAADVDDTDLDRYLHMRSGAVFAALAAVDNTDRADADEAAGIVCGVADVLREARDPACADVPAAHLNGIAQGATGKDAELAIEAVLCVRREQALSRLSRDGTGSITGSILLALYKQDWPRIIAAPPGTKPAATSAWSRLWTAWLAARRHRY